jgi:hypothetical protein
MADLHKVRFKDKRKSHAKRSVRFFNDYFLNNNPMALSLLIISSIL